MPSSRARRAASVPRMPQSTDTITVDLVGVEPVDRGRLESVAVAQPFGDEVDDLAAEHLERAPQDDGRGDAVDVVVAVDGDPFAGRERPLEARHGALHVGQEKRIVEVVERRVAETCPRPPGRRTRAGTAGARRSDGCSGRPRAPRRRLRCTAGAATGASSSAVVPWLPPSGDAVVHASAVVPAPASTKAWPSRPIRRNLS